MIRISPGLRYCLIISTLTAVLSGCAATRNTFGLGGGDKSNETAAVDEVISGDAQTAGTNSANQASLRRYYGSGYCPKIEIRHGTEAIRKYEKQNEPSASSIIWQASIGETARQCTEDPNGTMTIKVGVSGRILAGPKGGPSDVTVPIRIAVVKFQEAVLASELYKEQVAIGDQHSTVFRRVYQVEVPSPGNDRDYIIYVGFDNEKQRR